ncbi:hypothetical protein V6N11_037533 [Hibiscus sabdariffa]
MHAVDKQGNFNSLNTRRCFTILGWTTRILGWIVGKSSTEQRSETFGAVRVRESMRMSSVSASKQRSTGSDRRSINVGSSTEQRSGIFGAVRVRGSMMSRG